MPTKHKWAEINKALVNRINNNELAEHAKRSIETLMEAEKLAPECGNVQSLCDRLHADLKSCLETFFSKFDPSENSTQKTTKQVESAKRPSPA